MFSQAPLLGREVRQNKMNFLFRYPEATNLATLKTRKEGGKEYGIA